MSTEVCCSEEDLKAIAGVRNDGDDTKWALYSHEGNPNQLHFVESGTGDVSEVVGTLSQDQYQAQMSYVFLRVEESIDESVTIKFVVLEYSGPNIPFVKRGTYGVVKGSVQSLFSPFVKWIEMDLDDFNDNQKILAEIGQSSGQANKVLDALEAKSRPERGFTSGTTTKSDPTGATPTKPASLGKVGKHGSSFTGMAMSAGGITMSPEAKETIAAIRQDDSDLTWCVLAFENDDLKKPIVLLHKGGDFKTHFDQKKVTELGFLDDKIVLAFVKLLDVVDGIPTYKFVFVQWIGENAKVMLRAKMSTLKGVIEQLFYPTHICINASQISEVSERNIAERVTSASGTKSRVK